MKIFDALRPENGELAREIEIVLGRMTNDIQRLSEVLGDTFLESRQTELTLEQELKLDQVKRDAFMLMSAAIYLGFHELKGVIKEEVDFSPLQRGELHNLLTSLLEDPEHQESFALMMKGLMLEASRLP